MNDNMIKSGVETSFINWLMKIPVISFCAETRGWPYLISWGHRMTGILLVIFLWAHICSVEALQVAQKPFVPALLVWILAIPMAFHSFNGARLILYESFGHRNDDAMIRSVLVLSLIYVIVLGLLSLMGNLSVSPSLYWVIMVMQALVVSYGVSSRIFNTRHSFLWKMQRISGSFLLIMVPAYFLFIQLKPSPQIEANFFIMGIQSLFLTAVYILLLLAALFHAGYGLWSLLNDYISSRNLRRGLGALVACMTVIFAWIGLLAALSV